MGILILGNQLQNAACMIQCTSPRAQRFVPTQLDPNAKESCKKTIRLLINILPNNESLACNIVHQYHLLGRHDSNLPTKKRDFEKFLASQAVKLDAQT
jgi:hypothetical protein